MNSKPGHRARRLVLGDVDQLSMHLVVVVKSYLSQPAAVISSSMLLATESSCSIRCSSIDRDVGDLPVDVLDERLDLLEVVAEEVEALVRDVVEVVDLDGVARRRRRSASALASASSRCRCCLAAAVVGVVCRRRRCCRCSSVLSVSALPPPSVAAAAGVSSSSSPPTPSAPGRDLRLTSTANEAPPASPHTHVLSPSFRLVRLIDGTVGAMRSGWPQFDWIRGGRPARTCPCARRDHAFRNWAYDSPACGPFRSTSRAGPR